MIKTFKAVALVALILSLPYAVRISPAEAGAEYNRIGFASMNLINLPDKEWNYEFRDMAQEAYRMKYGCFRKIMSKLQKRGLVPITLISPEEKANAMLLPNNVDAVNRFHAKFDSEFEYYLSSLAMANSTSLIVFDYIKEPKAKKFIKGKGKLYLNIVVYSLESNTIGMQYVSLTPELFDSPHKLKAELQKGILTALEDNLINLEAGGDYSASTTSPGAPTETAASGGYWE